MKRLLSVILVLVMALSLIIIAPTSSAAKIEKAKYLDKKSGTIVDLYKNGTAVVRGYNEKYIDICDSDFNYWKIPSKIKGHKVTKIQGKSIMSLDCRVRIPKSVKSIDKKFIKSVRTIEPHSKMTASEFVVYEGSYAQKVAVKNHIDYYISGSSTKYTDLVRYKFYDANGKLLPFEKDRELPVYNYTGYEIRPKFSIKNGNKKLKKNVDYTVKYVNNIACGEGMAIVSGKGNYFNTATALFFKIRPDKIDAKFKKVDSTTIGNDADLDKDNGYFKYDVQYSTDKKFKSHKTVRWNTLTTGTIGNLEKGKTYYLRMRAVIDYFMIDRNYPWKAAEKGKYPLKFYYSKTYEMSGKWSDTSSVKL